MKGAGREVPMGAYGSVVSTWVDSGADSEWGARHRPSDQLSRWQERSWGSDRCRLGRWAWLYGADEVKDTRREEKGVKAGSPEGRGVNGTRTPKSGEKPESESHRSQRKKPSQEEWSAGTHALKTPGEGGELTVLLAVDSCQSPNWL